MHALIGSHTHRATRMRLARESAYGTLPDVPVWQSLPRLPQEPGPYGFLRLSTPERPLTSAPQHLRATGVGVRGGIVCPGTPAAADLLLDLALTRGPGGAPASCTLDAWAPEGGRRLSGLCADELTWRLDTDGSRLEARLLGRADQELPALTPADFPAPDAVTQPFGFRRAQVSAAGTALAGIRGMTLSVRNGLQPGPPDAADPAAPAWVRPGRRRVSLRMHYYASNGALRALQRAGAAFALDVLLTHAAGWSLSLEFPALFCREVQDDPAPGEPLQRTAECEAAAPGGADLAWTMTPAP